MDENIYRLFWDVLISSFIILYVSRNMIQKKGSKIVMSDLLEYEYSIQEYIGAIRDLKLYNYEQEYMTSERLKDYSLKIYNIEFRDANFNYDDLKDVLPDINFTACQSEVTALVGSSEM